MAREKRYDESSISVFKGLEPVKQRPGMYTKTENPLHILQEVIDNSADEAIGGYATEISIECHDDKSFSVTDNGRGIPVGMHPEEKISTIELYLLVCTLEANLIKITIVVIIFQVVFMVLGFR